MVVLVKPNTPPADWVIYFIMARILLLTDTWGRHQLIGTPPWPDHDRHSHRRLVHYRPALLEHGRRKSDAVTGWSRVNHRCRKYRSSSTSHNYWFSISRPSGELDEEIQTNQRIIQVDTNLR